ncbi:MAG TPA: class I lanthipeptide [Thermoanaerobaculia bacterium]|jgi:hypothetical protein
MKKKRFKKLTLRKETLERLDDWTLEKFVVGGSDSVPQCCCSKDSGCLTTAETG